MRLKKAFAVILAIAMVFGAVSLASAAVTTGGFADAADNKHANQIAYLKALGIAKGDHLGNFNPDSPLTRQEFVTFVARLAGQEAAAEFMAGIPSRYLDDKDIADWARGAVNLADANGWVQGYDDGKFHPTDSLTYAQAVTVLVRVLGHEATVTGAWPNAHIIKGINLGLNEGVTLTPNTPITRADMGRLLYNSLFVERLEKQGDDWNKIGSFMTGKAWVASVVNVTSDNITTNLMVGDPPANWAPALAKDVTLIGANTLAAVVGLEVRLTLDKDNKVYIVEVLDETSTGSVLTFVKFGTVAASAENNWTSSNVLELSDGSKVKYDNTATVRVNGSPIYKMSDAGSPAWDQVVAKDDWVIITEKDGKVSHLDVIHFTKGGLLQQDGKAKSAANNYDHIKFGNEIYSVAGAAITLNGASAGVTDLQEADVVAVAEAYASFTAGNWVKRTVSSTAFEFDEKTVAHTVVATRNVVEGTVTRVKKDSDGRTVTIKLADDSSKEIFVDAGISTGFGTGDVVKFYLDAHGDAAAVEVVTGGELEYVLLKAVYEVSEGGTTTHWAVVDQKGETREIKVDNNYLADVDKIVSIDNAGAVSIKSTRAQVDTAATVIAASADGKSVTLNVGGTVRVTADDFAVYKHNGTKFGAYVAPETLKAGDKVQVKVTGGEVDVIVTNLPVAKIAAVAASEGSNEIKITFDLNVTIAGDATGAGFAVTVNGHARNVSAVAVDNVVTLTIDGAPLAQDNVVKITYQATDTDHVLTFGHAIPSLLNQTITVE